MTNNSQKTKEQEKVELNKAIFKSKDFIILSRHATVHLEINKIVANIERDGNNE